MLSRRQKQADVGPPVCPAQGEKARAGEKGGKEGPSGMEKGVETPVSAGL